MKQDYASGKIRIGESLWFEPLRGKKGHYLLNLMEYTEMVNFTSDVLATHEHFEIELVIEPDFCDADDHIVLDNE